MKTLRTKKQLIRSIYSAHKAVFLLFKRRSENSKARKNGVSHRKYKDWGASAGRNISLFTLDIYTTTFWNIRALLGLQVFLAQGFFLFENSISYQLLEYSYILIFSQWHIKHLITYEFEIWQKRIKPNYIHYYFYTLLRI